MNLKGSFIQHFGTLLLHKIGSNMNFPKYTSLTIHDAPPTFLAVFHMLLYSLPVLFKPKFQHFRNNLQKVKMLLCIDTPHCMRWH